MVVEIVIANYVPEADRGFHHRHVHEVNATDGCFDSNSPSPAATSTSAGECRYFEHISLPRVNT